LRIGVKAAIRPCRSRKSHSRGFAR
jgi:hypothetical protein